MTQTERLTALLADGEWHPVEEAYDLAGPSARTRLSEMRRQGGYECRSRARYDARGRLKYVAKDWRRVS